MQTLVTAGESSDGNARIALTTEHPRVGRPLEGSVYLAKDPEPGASFRVELSCTHPYTSDGKKHVETAFLEKQDVQAVRNTQGWTVPFRFEVPASAPPTMLGGRLAADHYVWYLSLSPVKGGFRSGPGFELELGPAPIEELRALEASETPAQKAAIDAISRETGQYLLPHQRAKLRALSPEDLALARKAAAMPAKFISGLVKWAIIVSVILFVAIPVVLWVLFEIALRQGSGVH